jgi:hypothetical protein
MDGLDGLHEGIGRDGNAVDPFFNKELREVGEVGGTLTTNADLDTLFFRRTDEHAQKPLNGVIALIIEMGDKGGVAVEAEGQLSEIIAANGEAVDLPGEFPGEDDVGRQFGHEIDFETMQTLTKIAFRHDDLDPEQLRDGAAERDHDGDIVKPHFFAHLFDGLAF